MRGEPIVIIVDVMSGIAGVIYLSCVLSGLKGQEGYSGRNSLEVKVTKYIMIITISQIDNARLGIDI
jgi:hypothetical protein